MDGLEKLREVLGISPEPEEKDEKPREKTQRLRTHTVISRERYDKRRFFSEQALMDCTDWHWENGMTIHCLTGGNVDFMTFLRFALRQQQAEYMLVSSWCYGVEDVAELAEWVDRGMVMRLDAYMGEIASASYAMCQQELEDAAQKSGGRVGVFRNHAKVGVVIGERFDCVITSSANVNTNPRCENTVITCDADIAMWYKDFFDGINPFNGSPEGWKPWSKNTKAKS